MAKKMKVRLNIEFCIKNKVKSCELKCIKKRIRRLMESSKWASLISFLKKGPLNIKPKNGSKHGEKNAECLLTLGIFDTLGTQIK